MSDKNVNPKHSTGKGAQAEQHNTSSEDSYVENPKEEKNDDGNGDDYLKNKWKKISKDFEKTYNLEVSETDYKGENFSDTLKNLENKTGKSREKILDEIRNWQNS
ncbi:MULTISPECIES: hypothetical protein [Aequorivita]|uniref:General stress protein CsbD n=2 Tax=Aequorivita TaxID=153265 RepID=A0AB35YY43_9FLAO|nr:hypothetical protein [Aequorivita sp. Ant34-E75]WGF92442.1 hypothetical protein QCQ61_14700 [Aequorivita sp. Ant34-E75]